MKYKVGDRVRIKSIDWYNKNKDEYGAIHCEDQVFNKYTSEYCGKIVTIDEVYPRPGYYHGYDIREDLGCKTWTDEMFEGLVEEETKPEDMGEVSDGYHTFNELYEYRMLYNAALFNEFAKQRLYDVHKSRKHSDGKYPFGDSNWFIVMAELPTGQISNHYELKDWNLFQVPEKEKANVWDEHTPKDVADRIRKFLTPKPKYPLSYEECYKIIVEHTGSDCNPKGVMGYKYKELQALQKLLVCRDAYWKIAGDEMGSGKPWELSIGTPIYYIYYNRTVSTIKNDYADDIQGNIILAFPTKEMRDAFYENFKELIESVKELL